MGTVPDTYAMGRNRGLLTDRERAVLQGDVDDVENPESYRQKIQSRVRKRTENAVTDLELLRDDDPEFADELHQMLCENTDGRFARLEREVKDLREEVTQLRDE